MTGAGEWAQLARSKARIRLWDLITGTIWTRRRGRCKALRGFKKVLPRRQVGAIGAGSKFSLEIQQAPCQPKRPLSDAESRSENRRCQLYLAVLRLFS